MKKRKTEFKLDVVQSFLAGEGGAKLLARRWLVPEEKIRMWVNHYRLHSIEGFKKGTANHINHFELGQHGRYRTNVWQYAGAKSSRPKLCRPSTLRSNHAHDRRRDARLQPSA